MTKEYEEYLLSDEWKAFKKKALEHHSKKCAKCNRTKSLQIHHLHYRNIFHEELEDVQVLCKKHHEEVHGINVPKKKVKLTKSQKKKLKKRKNKNLHLIGRKFNKKVKGNHALKLQHPVLDKIAELKSLREGRFSGIKNK
jgi:hypothetical protein